MSLGRLSPHVIGQGLIDVIDLARGIGRVINCGTLLAMKRKPAGGPPPDRAPQGRFVGAGVDNGHCGLRRDGGKQRRHLGREDLVVHVCLTPALPAPPRHVPSRAPRSRLARPGPACRWTERAARRAVATRRGRRHKAACTHPGRPAAWPSAPSRRSCMRPQHADGLQHFILFRDPQLKQLLGRQILHGRGAIDARSLIVPDNRDVDSTGNSLPSRRTCTDS